MARLEETFNQPDSVTVGPVIPWTQVVGTWDTHTQQLRLTSGAAGPVTLLIRAEADLSTSDMRAEVIFYFTGGSGTEDGGPVVRFSSSAATGYGTSNDLNSQYVTKYVAGVQTNLSNVPVSPAKASGDKLAISIYGSTIETTYNGVKTNKITDTSITSGTRAGIAGYNSNTTSLLWDHWSAEDYYPTAYDKGTERFPGVRSPINRTRSRRLPRPLILGSDVPVTGDNRNVVMYCAVGADHANVSSKSAAKVSDVTVGTVAYAPDSKSTASKMSDLAAGGVTYAPKSKETASKVADLVAGAVAYAPKLRSVTRVGYLTTAAMAYAPKLKSVSDAVDVAAGAVLYAPKLKTVVKVVDVAAGAVLYAPKTKMTTKLGHVDVGVVLYGPLVTADNRSKTGLLTVGALLYAPKTKTTTKLADVTAGSVLYAPKLKTASKFTDLAVGTVLYAPKSKRVNVVTDLGVGVVLYAPKQRTVPAVARLVLGVDPHAVALKSVVRVGRIVIGAIIYSAEFIAVPTDLGEIFYVRLLGTGETFLRGSNGETQVRANTLVTHLRGSSGKTQLRVESGETG